MNRYLYLAELVLLGLTFWWALMWSFEYCSKRQKEIALKILSGEDLERHKAWWEELAKNKSSAEVRATHGYGWEAGQKSYEKSLRHWERMAFGTIIYGFVLCAVFFQILDALA
jgi:hypothetical protein